MLLRSLSSSSKGRDPESCLRPKGSSGEEILASPTAPPLAYGSLSLFLLLFSVFGEVSVENILQVDLVGGYYDAGDNVKFGFPMAFTVTMLSWSVLEFGGMMKGELKNAREAIRWATDYLLKATARPNTIYVQVG